MNTRTWKVAVATGAAAIGLGGFAVAGADAPGTEETKPTGQGPGTALETHGATHRPASVNAALEDKWEEHQLNGGNVTAAGTETDSPGSPASPATAGSPDTADEQVTATEVESPVSPASPASAPSPATAE